MYIMKRMFLSLFLVLLTTSRVVGSDLYYDLSEKIENHINDVLEQNDDYKGLDRCAENGKYANNFTIDRRCYVNDEAKQMSPYNAVVAIGNTPGSKNYSYFDYYTTCTGVIVKNPNDEQLYVYSAGHCVSDQPQSAVTQDGRAFPISNIIDEYDKKNGKFLKDYAVFTIPQEYQSSLPYVMTTTNFTRKNVDIVGYGTLPILSDTAIKTAKKEWGNKLRGYKSNASKEQKDIIKQIAKNNTFIDFLPTEIKLKASFNCDMPKNKIHIGYKNVCQAFRKDSGGPVFDTNGRLVAVVSNGLAQDSLGSYINFYYSGAQPITPIDNQLKQQTIK